MRRPGLAPPAARRHARVVGSLVAAAVVAATGPARAAPDADLLAALDAADGADVVAFELPSPAHAPRVRGVTIAHAPVATVLGVLADPSHYAQLIPALVRSQEVARRGDVRVVEWELEVPLFNLSGTLELRPHAGGIELALIDGDLSPGRVVFETAPRPDGGTTVQIDARFDVSRSSFFLRRIMARSNYGQSAALAAATWVALRAVALRAEHAREARASRPTAPFAPSPPGQPDGRTLARAPFAPLAARGAAALVRLAPSGRLASVSVGVPAREAPTALATRLGDPKSWRDFPGWHRIQSVPPTPPSPARITVEDAIPLVDFDATWSAEPPPRTRWWTATDGAARGAWFGWEVFPGAPSTLAVLSMCPRLEATGSLPRRFIEAEPLLEHGMSLALVFVDAVSATRGGGH